MSKKYLDEVKLKVKSKADINLLQDDGENLLHKSIRQYGRLDVMKFLVSKGADIHGKTRYGATVLHLVIQNIKKGNHPATTRLVDYLLEKSVDVKAKDNLGNTALHYLVEKSVNSNQSISLAESLVKAGARVNAINKQKQAAIHIAVENGNYALCDYFISKGADLSCKMKKSKTPLTISVEKSNLEIAKLLIVGNARLEKKIEEEGVSLLHIAIKSCRQGKLRLSMVRELLNGGADIDARDQFLKTPLHAALTKKDEDCAKLLIQNGSSINTVDDQNYSPLMTAVELDLENSVKLLLPKGANPNYVKIVRHCNYIEKMSILGMATRRQNLPIIRLLSDFGADTSCKKDLNSHLDASMRQGHAAMMKYFLDKGADVNSKRDGETVLSRAFRYQYGKSDNVIQILLDHGADVTLEDKDGKTPLERGMQHEYWYDRSVYCLVRHLALMRAEGQIIGKRNRLFLKKEDKCKKFYVVCLHELRRLQIKKIPESNVSLYDVLIKTEDEMVRCLQNKSIVDAIRSNDFYNVYPVYAWNFRHKLSKAQERFSLMNKGRRFLSKAVDFDVPVEILTLICEFLTNEDLISLSKVHLRGEEVPKPFGMTLRGARRRRYC